VFWKLFEKYFSVIFFSSLFQIFCVKRSNDGSGYPDGRVESFGRPFFLSGQAYFCDLLRGTTFKRHLSSVRTVNPVGLYRIALRAAAFSFAFLVLFLVLYIFSVLFMSISLVHVSSLQFISTPSMFLYSFTNLF
jgi:hypothetical protein